MVSTQALSGWPIRFLSVAAKPPESSVHTQAHRDPLVAHIAFVRWLTGLRSKQEAGSLTPVGVGLQEAGEKVWSSKF